ncbi:MAG: preprotein translocase subunit SecG [Verrucomicrobiota bacterium]|nr:preprotein translocase subunit SecG [Verrucomicrobiota bacterium]
MAILLNFLLVIYVLVAVLMILVILMQRPKSEGLGAAFGGGVTDNIFGAQTTNVLTKFTGWMAGIFFTLTFLLSILYSHRAGASSELRRELMKNSSAEAMPVGSPGAPVATPAAAAPALETAAAPAADNAPAAPAAMAQPSAMPADLAVGAVRPVPPANTTSEQPGVSPAASASASPAGKR